MSLHSTFRFWAFLPVVLLLLVTGMLTLIAEKLLERPELPPFGIFVFSALFSFTWIWLGFGELRTKIIKVHIKGEEVIVWNYFGFGARKVYNLSQFDGLETALLPSRYKTYESLYLVENGKKVVKLSQFYHANYSDLKDVLNDKLQNLGQKGFSYLQELKEIFT